MGKKNKHSKDKLHKTVSELKSHHIGANRELELSVLHRRLKFDFCCLSLNKLETGKPVSGLVDEDGYCYVFDSDLIVKFLEKFQIHPITGNKVSAKDLIQLKFHKNNEGQYHCPIIYKLLNQHSRIVANKKTGHVYSFEAYQQLNLKPNNFKDLLTDEVFTKEDIVTIQDPDKADTKWAVTNFYYVKNRLKLEEESGGSIIRDIDQSEILKSSLEEYKRHADTIAETFNKIVGQNVKPTDDDNLDKINSALESDGAVARSVTSTVAPLASVQKAAKLSDDQILYPRIKKRGYLQLVTSMGPLNLELFCDRTPKTCHNFMLLASRGYYDNTVFHRLIKNFILQGGDPTGTGSGGQSAWGEPFQDECHGDLKHSGRGVVAMANSGPGTNKSQFYITLRGAWEHLDGKHTVFGRVVGGEETLNRIESIEVDGKDRPKKEIRILKVVKYVDPFEEVELALEEERKRTREQEEAASAAKESGTKKQKEAREDRPRLKKFRSGVGAYIDLASLQKSSSTASSCGKQNVPQATVATNPMTDQDTAAQLASNANADFDAEVGAQQPPMATSLASKLASLSGHGARRKATKAYGDFSNW